MTTKTKKRRAPKPLTLDGFIQKLRETPRDWSVTFGGLIRRQGHCPISACAGDAYSALTFRKAAKAIGLSDLLAGRIVDSADNWSRSSGAWFDPALRAKLLDACGLTVATKDGNQP